MKNWADTDNGRGKPGHGGWYTPEGVTGTGWQSTEKRLKYGGFDGQKGSSSSYGDMQGSPMNVDDHPANNVEHPSGNNDQ